MKQTLCFLAAILFLLPNASDAQRRQTPATTPKADTAKAITGGPATPGRTTGPRPYKEIITAKAITDSGLFILHKVDEKYFWEIRDSLMGRDFLSVTRISKAAAGMRQGFFGYAGDQISQNVLRFERGPNNKIFLRSISYAEYARDSTSEMYNTVMNSNVQPIVAAFDVKAWSTDGKGAVIEVNDFLMADNEVTSFSPRLKTTARVGSIQSDKSYISRLRSFPINVESRMVKTYSRTAGPSTPGSSMPPIPPGGNLTLELNNSMVLLPAVPMQARYFDPRVGFFTVGYTDFDLNPQGVERVEVVKRWRLEPKPDDMDKYKRGELVEPQKPIVFYIDPATPAKWVPFLIQGVNDWQVAFEKAGFKNAIFGKRAPTYAEDSTWSLDDARNSAIVYKPSDIPNASGPSISDPRSGEIMESHINWYHNVMELLRNWYMIQTAATDERARKMEFDDALMGQLIRFVSSHEVGHTLGLRHNFGSSSTVPVEKLRDKKWLEENGHTPSIMDYARFNYVAQPEDKIDEKGLFPRIGDYDKWAIEWGYRLFPQYNTDTEKGHLNKWVMDKLTNKRLWFGTEIQPDDPRSQSEDLGNNAMLASNYGIKNLKRIVPNLTTWTKVDNRDYTSLSQIYDQVVGQYSRYMNHVAKNIGGIYETPRMVEEPGVVYEFVPQNTQKEAMQFLNTNLFKTPTWLIDKDVMALAGKNPLYTIGQIQDNVINRLVNNNTFSKLSSAEAALSSNAYTGIEMLNDLRKNIFTEINSGGAVDIYRRNLQKSFVNRLISFLNPPPATGISFSINTIPPVSIEKSDGKSIVRAALEQLENETSAAGRKLPNGITKYHYMDLAARIKQALDPK